MSNYILKAAVVAGQIDSVNGFTVYFKDGATMEVDNAFITQQSPGLGDYVLDGTKVMSRAKFEEMYMEEPEAEVTDEGEIIIRLHDELDLVHDNLNKASSYIGELETRLATPPVLTEGGDNGIDSDSSVVEEVDPEAPVVDPGAPVAAGGEGSDPVEPTKAEVEAEGSDPAVA